MVHHFHREIFFKEARAHPASWPAPALFDQPTEKLQTSSLNEQTQKEDKHEDSEHDPVLLLLPTFVEILQQSLPIIELSKFPSKALYYTSILTLLTTILSNCTSILETTRITSSVLNQGPRSNLKVSPLMSRLSQFLPVAIFKVPFRYCTTGNNLWLVGYSRDIFALPAIWPRASKYYSSFSFPSSARK